MHLTNKLGITRACVWSNPRNCHQHSSPSASYFQHPQAPTIGLAFLIGENRYASYNNIRIRLEAEPGATSVVGHELAWPSFIPRNWRGCVIDVSELHRFKL